MELGKLDLTVIILAFLASIIGKTGLKWIEIAYKTAWRDIS